MVEKDKTGVKPLYRSREWNTEERKISKSNKKGNWWNNSKSQIQYSTVLFVTPTPGGVLMKDVQQRESEVNNTDKERIKVVGKGGLKTKNILCSKSPLKSKNVNNEPALYVPKVKLWMLAQPKSRFLAILIMLATDGLVPHARKTTSLRFMKEKLVVLLG